MTSVWISLGMGLVAIGQAGTTAVLQKLTGSAASVAAQPAVQRSAPRQLDQQLGQLGRNFSGQVGIAVKSVEDGWTVGWNENVLAPQQSVSKLWVAITALDAVDRGRISLSDRVTLTRGDLTLFHQPIASKVLGNGGHTTSLESLLTEALTKSDNTANDKLMRVAGGPEEVRSMLTRKGLAGIRFYDGERSLQSRIAGLTWSQNYSIGRAFYEAREALPLSVRRAAFNRYLEDPYDGATAKGIVDALARLKAGQLLSPASTARLLTIMGNTRTGPNRLKGGLKPGWTLSHKTGTGQVLGSTQAGYNDIGVLTAPDGRSYAVAVMIKKTATPLPTRMKLMNDVVRSVIEQHESTRSPIAGL